MQLGLAIMREATSLHKDERHDKMTYRHWRAIKGLKLGFWKERLDKLVKYKHEHSHCNIPQKGELGTWVTYQRK